MSLGSLVSGFVPMLRLGSFNFSLNKAVFQEMRRSTEFKWASQERFGQLAAKQFVGFGDDAITLPGVIYPQWKGSSSAMSDLRALAAQGKPQLLLDGKGMIYGRWVITNVDESRSVFGAFTEARKIEFTVTLQKFDGSDGSLLADLVAGLIVSALTA